MARYHLSLLRFAYIVLKCDTIALVFASIFYLFIEVKITNFNVSLSIAKAFLGWLPRISPRINILFTIFLILLAILLALPIFTSIGEPPGGGDSVYHLVFRYKDYLVEEFNLGSHEDYIKLPTGFGLKASLIVIPATIVVFTYIVWLVTNGFKYLLDFLAVSFINLTIMVIMLISNAIITALQPTETEYIVFLKNHVTFIGKNWILKLPKELVKEFHLIKSIGMTPGRTGDTLFYTLRVDIENQEYNLWENLNLPSNIAEKISKHITLKGIKRYHYKYEIKEYWAEISEITH